MEAQTARYGYEEMLPAQGGEACKELQLPGRHVSDEALSEETMRATCTYRDVSSKLDSKDWVLSRKVMVLLKLAAGIIFRALDSMLDVVAAISFYTRGYCWWSYIAFAIIILSPLPQFLLVKIKRSWQTAAVGYLVPGSFLHIYKELVAFVFIFKLPQSALSQNVHKLTGVTAMNEILAGVECAFESLPQAILQLRVYYVVGGSALNLISIALSMLGVILGVFYAVKNLIRRIAWKSPVAGEHDVHIDLSHGHAVSLNDLTLSSETLAALLWLASKDSDLTQWYFNFTDVGDIFVQELARRCPGLHTIYLRSTKITDVAVQALAESCPLTEVGFSEVNITDASVTELARRCPGLWSVGLGHIPVTDAAVQELAQNCAGLSIVYLNNTDITDHALQVLASRCPELTEIYLAGTRITDVGMQALAQNCPRLTTLNVISTAVTEDALQQLEAKCPGIEIIR